MVIVDGKRVRWRREALYGGWHGCWEWILETFVGALHVREIEGKGWKWRYENDIPRYKGTARKAKAAAEAELARRKDSVEVR